MTIRIKIIIGFSVMAFFFLISLFIVYSSLQKVSSTFVKFSDTDVRLLNLAQQIRFEDITLTDSVRGIIIDASNTIEKQNYDAFAGQIDSHIKEVKTLPISNRVKEIFEELDKNNQQLVDMETEMMNLSATDKIKTLEIFNGEYAKLRIIFAANLNEFQKIQLNQIDTKVKDNLTYVHSRSTLSLIIIAIALMIGAVVAFGIARIISRPILVINTKLKELSQNEGDLRERLSVKSKDEIGQLASSFNKMMDTIQNLIKQVKGSVELVSSTSQKLSVSAESAANVSTEISDKIKEVVIGAKTQLNGAEESHRAMEEMVIGIQRIAEGSMVVAEKSSSSAIEAKNGNETIQKAIHQMESIYNSVIKAASAVKKLGNRSEEIELIVQTITHISTQTNLLSLNAAIEAARAGEHGRGFAVVANEVRKLATQSEESATKIAVLINEIHRETNQAVQSMEEGTVEVKDGLIVVEEAGNLFQKIMDDLQQVAGEVQELSAISEEMAASSEEVTASSNETAYITKTTTNSMQQSSDAVEKQLESIEEIYSSTNDLNKVSKQLSDLIQKFKA
ncbi:methyl-accepting chemotaxis protein [Paenibacillus psychroresistens]|uniref:Methyl-accepting chemotaxis protein n=1 Tax=Paenibacillus psychroresistens TaxID=1778678 RepID=A0A6B8RQD8_9BACL|nr:HAMP domain-containing methyl-accepting chemotaxis protein [Paenibacillus psychroresistens]QGQ97912.1 methyl-accepting chemotaxis protein [Paenibacillus psychroresistens]